MYKPSKKLEPNSLCQKHKKAEHSRKVLQAQETLRYMVSLDRMQRMQLIAINNRCLAKFNKIKRAEQISNRYAKKAPFLPKMEKLKLQLKLSARPSLQQEVNQTKAQKAIQQQTNEQQLYQQLIDEYLERVKRTRRIQTLANQNEIIQQACREIFKKIQERRNQLRFSTVSKRRKTEGTERSSSIKPSKHSISHYEFEENLERINKAKSYGEKLRSLKERMFLRKLRTLKQMANRNI